MKIWIIFDSKYGNNKKIAYALRDKLSPKFEVHVNYAKEISPQQVLAAGPDVFLFGGPRRIGKISYTLRKWVEKFAKLLQSKRIKLKLIAAWETHGIFKEADIKSASRMEQNIYNANLLTGERWKELIQKLPVEQLPLELLSLSVEGTEEKQTLVNGSVEQAIKFAENIIAKLG